MPRKNHLQKRINQLTREKLEALARGDRLVRENEDLVRERDEAIARAEEAERQLAKLGVLA